MDGESSAKRLRTNSNDSNNDYEIIDITDSPKFTENVEIFENIARDYINDDSFYANNPSLFKICHAFIWKKFCEWQNKTENLEKKSENSSENSSSSLSKPQDLKDNEFKKFIKSHQIVALEEFYSSKDNTCGLNSVECSSMDEIVSAGLIEKDNEFYIFFQEIILLATTFCINLKINTLKKIVKNVWTRSFTSLQMKNM